MGKKTQNSCHSTPPQESPSASDLSSESSLIDYIREDGYVPIDEVVEQMGVKRATVLNYIRQGKLEGGRFGQQRFVKKQSILSLMKTAARVTKQRTKNRG